MKLIYFIFLSYTLCLNSSFRRGFIFLPTLFKFLQNLEVQNLNEFDSNKLLEKYGKPLFHWATPSRLRFRASAWPNCWVSHSWAGSPLPIQGRAHPRRLVAVAAIDSSGRLREAVSKGVGEHHGEVGPDLRCQGGEGLIGVRLSVVMRFGRRGMLVRGSFGGCGGRLGARGGAW
jgi:hypothetical protein